MTLFLILHILILQIMDSPYQLSVRTMPNRVFSVLKTSYCALGKSGLARKALSWKILLLPRGFVPDISHRLLFRTRGKCHPSVLSLRLRSSLRDQARPPSAWVPLYRRNETHLRRCACAQAGQWFCWYMCCRWECKTCSRLWTEDD